MTGAGAGTDGRHRSRSSRPPCPEDPAIRGDVSSRTPVSGDPVPVASCPAGGFRIGLKVRADFLRAAKGRRAHGRACSLQVFRRPDEVVAPARFGLTVTRKVGGAVERNRIKRRMRAVLMTQDLQPQAGHDYVIVARRDALTMRFPDLAADLARAVRRSRDGGRNATRSGASGTGSAMKAPHGSRK